MSIVQELKRRNVFRMAVLYIIAAWLIMQATEVLITLVPLPHWIGPIIIWLLAIGFPISLIFSWFYEITPEGISLEKNVDPEQSITHVTGRRLDFLVISLLIAAVILFAYDKWWMSGPPEKSIAVLPFVNMSNDPEQEYFSDGISEELLNVLAKIPGLRVVARSSSFQFKGENRDIIDIGQQLNVAHVLEGSVRKAGSQLRITAQLIDARNGFHMWSKIYDRTLTTETIFAIQREMATSIAGQLEAALSPDDQKLLDKRPTENLEAYNAYLMAGQFYARSGYSDLFEAERYYLKAIELDPDYAAAHTGLVRTYNQLADTGAITLAELKEKAEPIAERAIALDDRSGGAWSALASFRFFTNGEKVEEMFKKALALSPNSSTILKDYAEYLRKTERYEEAIPYIEKGLAINPLSTDHLFELGRTYFFTARFDEALAAFEKIRILSPANPQGFYSAAGVYFTLGDFANGLVLQEQAAMLDPDDYEVLAFVAWEYLDLGDETSANKWLGRALDKGPDQALPLAMAAAFRVYAGEYEEAAAIARTALQNQVDDRWGAYSIFLRVLRDTALRSGDYSEALEWYRQLTPALFAVDVVIDQFNTQDAVNLALLMRQSGEQDQANRLLNAVRTFEDPTLGVYFYNGPRGIADVHALAIAGQTEEAINAFRVAVDNRFRASWRLFTELDPNMESLLDDPRYQDMIAEIRTDMGEQLKQLREKQEQDEE